MEHYLGEGTYKFLFFYEFLGTALLMFSINVSETQPLKNLPFTKPESPWAVSWTVMAIDLVLGPITGAHINPAVTVAVLISNLKIIE